MIKAKVNHSGIYDGIYFEEGKVVELPDHALEAFEEGSIEVLGTVDEPKETKKAIESAAVDKQIKSAVVNK